MKESIIWRKLTHSKTKRSFTTANNQRMSPISMQQNIWYPELEHCKMELTEYPLEEEYEDQQHRQLLTKCDTETMKRWLDQEHMFTPKLQCDSCKAKKCENCNLLNNSSSIEEKELYEKLWRNVEVVELNGKKRVKCKYEFKYE